MFHKAWQYISRNSSGCGGSSQWFQTPRAVLNSPIESTSNAHLSNNSSGEDENNNSNSNIVDSLIIRKPVHRIYKNGFILGACCPVKKDVGQLPFLQFQSWLNDVNFATEERGRNVKCSSNNTTYGLLNRSRGESDSVVKSTFIHLLSLYLKSLANLTLSNVITAKRVTCCKVVPASSTSTAVGLKDNTADDSSSKVDGEREVDETEKVSKQVDRLVSDNEGKCNKLVSSCSDAKLLLENKNDERLVTEEAKSTNVETEENASFVKANQTTKEDGLIIDKGAECFADGVSLVEHLQSEALNDEAIRLLSCSNPTSHDLSLALTYLLKSVNLQNDKAMFNLAVCYETGRFGSPSIDKALDLYKKASDLGNEQASVNLQLLHDELGFKNKEFRGSLWGDKLNDKLESCDFGDRRVVIAVEQ